MIFETEIFHSVKRSKETKDPINKFGRRMANFALYKNSMKKVSFSHGGKRILQTLSFDLDRLVYH